MNEQPRPVSLPTSLRRKHHMKLVPFAIRKTDVVQSHCILVGHP